MYKRIPATYFDEFKDVYFSIVEFIEECGFTVIDNNAVNLFSNIASVKNAYVFQDPNTVHKLCLVFYDTSFNDSAGRICLFVFNDYDNTKYIHEQVGIVHIHGDNNVVMGTVLFDNESKTRQRRNKCDLVCVYNNKSLIFIYVPTNCYIYSHIFNTDNAIGGHLLFYGNFTKYHIGYDKDVIFTFGIMAFCKCGNIDSSGSVSFNISPISDTSAEKVSNKIFGMLYCSPEATYTVGSNKWGMWDDLTYNDYMSNKGKCPPPILTSFDYVNNSRFEVPRYKDLYIDYFSRCKTLFGSTLNNISILLPLIIYIMREPKILENWSSVGESKLINFIDMSHMNSGEVFIDTGIEEDYHKYFVFPAFCDYYDNNHNFIGMAVEIWAKENLLKEQSDDNLTVWLNDTFRNFDRIVIEFIGCPHISVWTYDELVPLLDSDGIFNLNKCGIDSHKCMVYGINNENGSTIDYKLTFSDCIKIKSITGYRE